MFLRKATIYYYDANNNENDNSETNRLEYILDNDNYISYALFVEDEKDLGEFDDDMDINYINQPKKVYEKYFD